MPFSNETVDLMERKLSEAQALVQEAGELVNGAEVDGGPYIWTRLASLATAVSDARDALWRLRT